MDRSDGMLIRMNSQVLYRGIKPASKINCNWYWEDFLVVFFSIDAIQTSIIIEISTG